MYHAQDIDTLGHRPIEDHIVFYRKAPQILAKLLTQTACLRHGQEHIERVSQTVDHRVGGSWILSRDESPDRIQIPVRTRCDKASSHSSPPRAPRGADAP